MSFALLCLAIIAGAVVQAENELNFLALGDWGGYPWSPYYSEIEETTANQMAVVAKKVDAKFVVALGDNFYFTGVKDEYDKRFQATYEQIFNDTSLQVPWYVIAGNHDHYGNVSAQVAYSEHNALWKFPDLWHSQRFTVPGTNRTVKLVLVDTILLCGNSGADDDDAQPKGPEHPDLAESQLKWIIEELQNSKDSYLLVGGHYPVWSIAEHGPTDCLVQKLKPLLEQYNVNAYLNGHEHNMQYLQEDDSNVKYFVIGAANFVRDDTSHKDMVPVNSSKFFWADKERMGSFAHFRATNEDMTVTFYDSLGAIILEQVMEPRKF